MRRSVEELPELIAAAEEEGLPPRIQDAGDFARRHHVLLLRHRESGINADISLGMLSFEKEAVERRIAYQAGELTIRLPIP